MLVDEEEGKQRKKIQGVSWVKKKREVISAISTQQKAKECSRMRGCRGLDAKVATQVPLPLLFKN